MFLINYYVYGKPTSTTPLENIYLMQKKSSKGKIKGI